MQRWLAVRLMFLSLAGSLAAAGACGARTGLPVGELDEEETEKDAGADARPDADAGRDGDAGPDVVDAGPDVQPVSCEEAGVTYIYLITTENDLYHFYPPDLSFVLHGTIACRTQSDGTPFSMGVDRGGMAHVLFNQGELFLVNTANADCKATDFEPNQGGFATRFGMGYSSNASDPGETLFVAGSDGENGLATIDTTTLELTFVGNFSSQIGDAELTGTGDSRLFAFGIDNSAAQQRHLAEIDKTNGAVLSDVLLPFPPNINAWAFAFWGGDFWFFTSTSIGSSQVTRYQPELGTFTTVANLDRTIVGAGVSTCAPK